MTLAMEGMQQALAALTRYAGTDRLYELEGDAVPADCAVERWQGWERASLGFEWWVDVLSSDSAWALDDLLGKTATLKTRLASGGFARRSDSRLSSSCRRSRIRVFPRICRPRCWPWPRWRREPRWWWRTYLRTALRTRAISTAWVPMCW